jgi:hypothetical protein
MDGLCLTLQVLGGGAIGDTAIKAQGIANTLWIAVRFDFNGIPCLCVPGGSSDKVARDYIDAVERRCRERGIPTGR